MPTVAVPSDASSSVFLTLRLSSRGYQPSAGSESGLCESGSGAVRECNRAWVSDALERRRPD